MPAEKAARRQERRRVINRRVRSSSRTTVKKAFTALAASDTDAAVGAVGKAISALDHAASKGILHRNNVARRKSRLMKHLNAATAAE